MHEKILRVTCSTTDSRFKHVRLPAIAEEDEIWQINNKTVLRKKGEALHPEREDISKLLESKQQMGEYSFAGQYQQNPAPIEGGIIKKKWIKFYNRGELFKAIQNGSVKIYQISQSWDTASKIEQNNDYSVCLTVLRDTKNKIYVLDCFRKKLEFPDLVKNVKRLHDEAKIRYKHAINVIIEDKNSGTQLIQTLRDMNLYPQKVSPEYDKQTRLMSVSYLIENGNCRFPDDNPDWWFDFEQELLRFPNAKHDDQCDALSQVLINNITTPTKVIGMRPF